jgi:hypothetical protein
MNDDEDDSGSAAGGGGGGNHHTTAWAHGFGDDNTTDSGGGGPKKKKARPSIGPGVKFSILAEGDNSIVIPGMGGGGGEDRPCRACSGGYFINENSRFVDAIAKIVREYTYTISPVALIDHVYEIGAKERAEVLNRDGVDIGDWSKEDVSHHLFNCMTDLNLWGLKQIRDLNFFLEKIKDDLYYIDPDTGAQMPNDKNWKLMVMLQSQIKTLMTVAPERAISYNPKLVVHSTARRSAVASRR